MLIIKKKYKENLIVLNYNNIRIKHITIGELSV